MYAHVCIGRMAVTVSAVSALFKQILFVIGNILFFNDLLAFDHAPAAEFTVILALCSCCSAALAYGIIFDLRTCDLLFILRSEICRGSITEDTSDYLCDDDDKYDQDYRSADD